MEFRLRGFHFHLLLDVPGMYAVVFCVQLLNLFIQNPRDFGIGFGKIFESDEFGLTWDTVFLNIRIGT